VQGSFILLWATMSDLVLDLFQNYYQTCPLILSFFGKLKHTLAVYQTFSKDKATAFKHDESALQTQLNAAYEHLQQDPSHPALQEDYSELHAQLQYLENQKLDGKKV
jgi:hypothetical protein